MAVNSNSDQIELLSNITLYLVIKNNCFSCKSLDHTGKNHSYLATWFMIQLEKQGSLVPEPYKSV